jgi:L-cysteine:1D-myo-inositol 2-amino-2-deoxy-alpha-D-glucopyranoside ligase
MVLRLYNSRSRDKEEFRPSKGNKVTLYVCGVTPYDTTHLGHAFTYLSFDILVRYLKHRGFEVDYAQNVTDIDDDILRRAREEGRNWKVLGNFWTRKYVKDMKSLNVMQPTHFVKATGSIPKIVEIVGALLRNGFAYKSGRDVYFDVTRFPRYGKLSGFTTKQMKILLKDRGGDPSDPNKRHPLDFILWQGKKGMEPSWNSPWGRGRPGWHIECSAMSNQYLGSQIDIHGGGRDLVFPHHESEIAQSESYTGHYPFARFFMHTAMVMHMGEKMAKSLGNLVLISDLEKQYSPNAIRWILASHHYRRVWEYEASELREAEHYAGMINNLRTKTRASYSRELDGLEISEFDKLMNDDLNTPAALRLLGDLLEENGNAATAAYMAKILGFLV